MLRDSVPSKIGGHLFVFKLQTWWDISEVWQCLEDKGTAP